MAERINSLTVALNAEIIHGNSLMNISQKAFHPATVILVRISLDMV